MPWRLARRAVRAFPAPAQLLLKRGKAAFQGDDWALAVHRLRVEEQRDLDAIEAVARQLPGRRRILVAALQQAPPWIEVSWSLAAALRLRGHDVRGVICDGGVPLCEMNLGRIERPSCAVCSGWLVRYADAFGLAPARLSECIEPDEPIRAQELVSQTSDAQLDSLIAGGISPARLARRELQRYHRGFVFDPAADPAFRPWVVSAILLAGAAERLLERERPDLVICASGRTLTAEALADAARRRGIRMVTWDTEPTFRDGLVFSHDAAAGLIPIDAEWSRVSGQALTEAQQLTLREFLGRWSRSENTPHPYNAHPLRSASAIRERLSLRADAPLVVAFGNSAWDMAAVDRDAGFASMFDWLFTLVAYAVAHPEVDLVVRAHPSETNVADDLKSRTPIGVEILRRFAPLPANIKRVDGSSPIDSYALAAMARVVTVYTSRIGLEIALGGRRPWLAGETTYRGKGFTRDLESKEELVRLLDEGAGSEPLPAASVELAERFAYLWFFRYVVRLPLLRPPSRVFELQTFRRLAPGGDPVLARVCDAIVEGTPFVDLS